MSRRFQLVELSDLLSATPSIPPSLSPTLLHPSLPALITSSALHYSLYSQSSFSPSVSPHQSRLVCLFFNFIMESNPPERAGGQRRQNHFQGACVSQQVWEHLWSQFWLREVELCYCPANVKWRRTSVEMCYMRTEGLEQTRPNHWGHVWPVGLFQNMSKIKYLNVHCVKMLKKATSFL